MFDRACRIPGASIWVAAAVLTVASLSTGDEAARSLSAVERPALAVRSYATLSAAAVAEQWRYVYQNGVWWYYQPNHRWLYWSADRWHDGPAASASAATIQRSAIVQPWVIYGPPSLFGPEYDYDYYNPFSIRNNPPGYWAGPNRQGAGWVGGFFSAGGGYGG